MLLTTCITLFGIAIDNITCTTLFCSTSDQVGNNRLTSGVTIHHGTFHIRGADMVEGLINFEKEKGTYKILIQHVPPGE